MSDEYTENATTFDAEDAPNTPRYDGIETKRDHYKRLERANEMWTGSWRDEATIREQDNLATLDAIASSLDLTDFQHEAAIERFEALPATIVRAYSVRLVALCVCGLVGAADGRNYHPNNCHPSTDSSSDFAAIADDIGASYTRIYKCWNRVEAEI